MKTKFSFSRLNSYQRIRLMVCCLVMGGGLILSISHLIPVFMDVMMAKLNLRDVERDRSQAVLPLYHAPSNQFSYFLPYLSHDTEASLFDETPLLRVDFTEGAQPIMIKITPKAGAIGPGGSVEMAFSPGTRCEYGDGHACIFEFLSPTGKRVVFTSLHSGVGGEGEAFRKLLEGTGFNQGLFRSSQVYRNAKALMGSDVALVQGEQTITGLRLISIARIPPAYLPVYIALPVEQTLDYALRVNGLDPSVFNQDMLVFETCGWRLPDEGFVNGLQNTSSSIYLGFVGMAKE